MHHTPPDWLETLFERFMDPYLFQGVYGDLCEDYHHNYQLRGKHYANFKILLNTIGYMRHFRLLNFDKDSTGGLTIWFNYFKASFRNLIRYKTNTAISIVGLTVSFIAAIAIYLYAQFESTFDQFHDDYSNIYRVTHDFTNAAAVSTYAQTFYGLREALITEIPETLTTTTLFSINGVIRRDTEIFTESNMTLTTPEFFEIFGFNLKSGQPEELSNPDVVMLSEEAAYKYFGRTDILGETLEMQNIFGSTWRARVAGVYDNLPRNTHIQTDILLPLTKLENLVTLGQLPQVNFTVYQFKWRWLGFNTYARFKKDSNLDFIDNRLNEIVSENRREINSQLNQEHQVWLQPIASIHTTPDIRSEITPATDIKLINAFKLIALITLTIAWINYINITTARSITRAKEVGIRKILGSHKSQLRTQFLIEAFIINSMAALVALLLFVPVSPYIEEMVGTQFFSGLGYNTDFILLIGTVVLVGTFLSGLYPAFVLSNYRPIQVLKGKLKYSSQGVRLRRILVILQLVFSLFLISAVFIVQSQMSFMINHNLGVDIDRTILLNGPGNEINNEAYTSRMETMRNRLSEIAGVEKITISSMVPGIESFWRGSTESRNGEEAGIFLHRANVDENYLDLFDIPVIHGRNFDPSYGNDKNGIIINELAAQNIGFPDPSKALGNKIYFTNNQIFEIIGIVGNFYQRGVRFAFEPRTFQLDTALVGNFISIRFNTNNPNQLLSEAELIYKSAFPDSPYNGRFLDEVFNEQYDYEEKFRNIFTAFTSVALVVACLGLVGLASYLLNQKSKEVSIRKVMGARTSTLFILLNKEYILISLVSLILTTPLIVFLMREWLSNYANRIEFQLYMFVLPFFIILTVILVITLGYTLRVVKANPAVTLREDG